MYDQSFGYWLKRKRKSLDLTQAELAGQVICSTATIRKIEAEERRPSAQIIERLAKIFNIPKNERTAFLQFARGKWKTTPGGIVEDVPWRESVPVLLRTNVPTPLTSFIGREKEVEEIIRLLAKDRLITLTGPGGVGKTRLAIQTSKKMLSKFKDGVWWVELAPLMDETLVPQALATSLGVRETPNQSLNEALTNFLHSKQILLVLDNCEHLITGCAQLVDRLLSVCPALKILATSREALGLMSEDVWSVRVLSMPNAERLPLEDFLKYEGIRLFVERASATRSDFTLTEQVALSVLQVCQRLDSLPLAIELAAARVKMMSVDEIAKYLDDRFNLLTAGSRTALPRHQTLRAAINWSYDLLPQPERIFFSRLSVFAGGFTLEAAEEVATGGEIAKSQVTDLLGQLINKSLVIVETHSKTAEAETHYGMLETIREYAREKLDEANETEQLHRLHRDFFISLAEQAETKLKSALQVEWLDRLEVEHDNLRAVLQWTLKAKDVEATLRLAGTLSWFWSRRGYLSEGRGWLERALAAAGASIIPTVRAKALYEAAYIALAQGDFSRAHELVEQCINLWRTLDPVGKHGLNLALVLLGKLTRDQGDPATARVIIEESVSLARDRGDSWDLAWSLISLGMAIRDQEDYALARSIIEESVALWREQGDLWGLAEALHGLALVAYRQGDYEVAYSLTEDALLIRRGLGDKHPIAYSLHNLGVFALAQGDTNRARRFFEQDVVRFRELGDKSGIVLSLQYQGLLALDEGDDVRAQSFYVEGLTLARETGPLWVPSNYLLGLANVAVRRDQFERAARLCGAANAHLAASASFWDAFERSYYERIVALARAALSESAFARAMEEGQAMTIEQAVAYGLEKSDD